MAIQSKGRMIRKDISRSAGFANLSFQAQSLFCLLIPHYSPHGKLNGNPYFIKGEVVPLIEAYTIPVIEKCMKEIDRHTNVKWFKHTDGLMYVHCLHWTEHQCIDPTKLGADDLPTSPENSGELQRTLENSGELQRTLENSGEGSHECKVKDQVEVEAKDQGEVQVQGAPRNAGVVEEIVADLNAKAGTSYRSTSRATRELVAARLKDGYTIDDFKRLHDNKVAEWRHDAKWCKFLRPETLYCASHFESYLNAPTQPAKKQVTGGITEADLK